MENPSLIIYAIFTCLLHTPPGGPGNSCRLLSEHPVVGTTGPYEDSRYTSLAACKSDLRFFERSKLPGWVNVCMQETVPAWGPAQ
jgi:hypothetical protein